MFANKGFSLISMMLALSITLVLSALILSNYSSLMDSTKVDSLVKQFHTIEDTVHSLYGSPASGVGNSIYYQYNYATLSESQVAQSGAFQKTSLASSTNIVSPYGEMVIVASPAITGCASNNCFSVEYSSDTLPARVCTQLVAALRAESIAISIGGTYVTTIASITTLCSVDAGSGKGNAKKLVVIAQ